MEGGGFFQHQNRLLPWVNNNNNNGRSDQGEIDLTLRLGQPNHHNANQGAPQGIMTPPQNFSNMNLLRCYSQAMQIGGNLQNARRDESSAGWFDQRFNQRAPWVPLPMMIESNQYWNNMSAGASSSPMVQQVHYQQSCKTCGKTESPLWRKGPDGPKTLCNGCGLKYSRSLKRR